MEGELTAICAEALLAVLESLGKPKPETDGAKDTRTAGQRNHDALHDAMLMLLRTNLLPDCNGVAATILITMTDQQYQNGQGVVRTGQGAYISTEQALTLHGDARLVPIIFGSTKQVSAYGTSHRIFTEGQRLAMIARDLGCSFPACTDPPHAAKPTTSPTTPSPDAPPSRTAPCCADITTASTRGWAGPAR